MTAFKYAALVAYSGGNYSGWQRQRYGLGIQEVLENALSKLSAKSVVITGAGRTDKGVHAVGQVISFFMDREWLTERLTIAVNTHLPDDIRVLRVLPVPDDFHARVSALWREYRYFIWHGNVCMPHLNGLVWWRKRNWDVDRVREACRILEGTHDFRAFCKTGECPEISERTLKCVRYQRWGAMSVLTVRAQSFLMNMMRIIVGNLDFIARGKKPLSWLEELLTGNARSCSGMTVPPCGLYFWRAGYNEIDFNSYDASFYRDFGFFCMPECEQD